MKINSSHMEYCRIVRFPDTPQGIAYGVEQIDKNIENGFSIVAQSSATDPRMPQVITIVTMLRK